MWSKWVKNSKFWILNKGDRGELDGETRYFLYMERQNMAKGKQADMASDVVN